MTTPPGRPPSEADRLILAAATGVRELTPDELRRVLEHVAQAGFDPNARERARGLLAGLEWQGRAVRGRDMLSPSEAHYLRHVVKVQEWPSGTTLQAYLDSIRAVVLDPRSGVLTCRYQASWQLTVVRRSAALQGPLHLDWILVDYRVAMGHWVTAYQPVQGLLVLQAPVRTDIQWLRRPG